MNNKLTRRTPATPATLPTKGFVVIQGRKHFVSLTPYQEPQLPAIRQQPEPAAQYVVSRERPSQNNTSINLQITPLNAALALIAITLFFVGASMFSIALTDYNNRIERTDRLQKLIYVEP